jgi:hypothetical protein
MLGRGPKVYFYRMRQTDTSVQGMSNLEPSDHPTAEEKGIIARSEALLADRVPAVTGEQQLSTTPLKPVPTLPPAETLEQGFRRLAATWRAETAHLSSCSDMFAHPSYQEIIGLGKAAVPLLLQDLANETEHWSHALQVITGTNPVPPADRGNLDKMAIAWLTWGREHGYR